MAASGANLASIGYHFGSKEALLNAAMIEAIDEWGGELERILATDSDIDSDTDLTERFESIWTRVIGSFDAHRPLWVASFEAFMSVQHSPELREQLSEGHEEARFGLVALLTAAVVAATHTSCHTDPRHNLPYERECYVGMYT